MSGVLQGWVQVLDGKSKSKSSVAGKIDGKSKSKSKSFGKIDGKSKSKSFDKIWWQVQVQVIRWQVQVQVQVIQQSLEKIVMIFTKIQKITIIISEILSIKLI